MLFTIVSYSFLMSLACSHVASPPAAIEPLNDSLDILLRKNSNLAYDTTPTSNLSVLLPYGFSVPNTRTYLRLGFGLPRHRLNPMDMGGLIAVIQDKILEGIARDGEHAYPGLNIIDEEQKFGWTLGDGFQFIAYSFQYSGRYFTWRQLSNVVEGLRLFLIVGERYFATVFNFWDGPGKWRDVLGGGGFVVDKSGSKIADQKI